MNPLVWGPSFWFVMHTVSLHYPDEPTYAERRTHYDFYHIVRDILPCEMCRQHYRELLEQYPVQPFLDSKTSLVTWVVMIHNQVNKRLGKPMIDREEMLANYEAVYARGSFCDPACPHDRADGRPRADSEPATHASGVSGVSGASLTVRGVHRGWMVACICLVVLLVVVAVVVAVLLLRR